MIYDEHMTNKSFKTLNVVIKSHLRNAVVIMSYQIFHKDDLTFKSDRIDDFSKHIQIQQ